MKSEKSLDEVWTENPQPDQLPVIVGAMQKELTQFTSNVFGKPVIVVKTGAVANYVGALIQKIGRAKKWVESIHNPVIASAWETHQKAMEAKNKLWKPLDAWEQLCKNGVKEYGRAIELERRKKEEEANRKAREEAEARRLEHAADVEAAGDKETAEHMLEEPIIAPPVIVEKEEIEGVRLKSGIWKVKEETLNLKALAKAVSVGKAPLKAITADIRWLNAEAKNYGPDVVGKFPGVEFYEDFGVARKP